MKLIPLKSLVILVSKYIRTCYVRFYLDLIQ